MKINSLKKRIGSLKKDHQESIISLKENCRESIASLKQNLRDIIASLKEEYEKEINSLRKEHQKEINSLREEYKASFKSLKKDYIQSITFLDEDYQEEITSLNEDHLENIESLKKSHLKKITSLYNFFFESNLIKVSNLSDLSKTRSNKFLEEIDEEESEDLLGTLFQHKKSPKLELKENTRLNSEIIEQYALLLKASSKIIDTEEPMTLLQDLIQSTSFDNDTDKKEFVKHARKIIGQNS